uniref:Uncharacterized protein n=1 Tax=Megaselia scalaris TaxID=36166 RepID=T1H1F8_MEGSC
MQDLKVLLEAKKLKVKIKQP